jgi:hypothetical protein
MAERKKLLLRLDPDVYDAVARWAADDLRSVNSQIEFALRLALKSAGRPPRSTGSLRRETLSGSDRDATPDQDGKPDDDGPDGVVR